MVGIASHPKSKVDAMIKAVITCTATGLGIKNHVCSQGKSIIGLNKDSIFPQSVLPDQPYICEHGKAGEERVYALYVGIIDYLQVRSVACGACVVLISLVHRTGMGQNHVPNASKCVRRIPNLLSHPMYMRISSTSYARISPRTVQTARI